MRNIITVIIFAALLSCGGPTQEESDLIRLEIITYKTLVTLERMQYDSWKSAQGTDKEYECRKELEATTYDLDCRWDEIHEFFLEHYGADHQPWKFHKMEGIPPRPQY